MKRLTASPDWPASWKMSHTYDELELSDGPPRSGYVYAYRLRRAVTLDFVQRYLPAGGRILDVAAAQGNFTLALAERGYEVTWNDFRAELEEYVRAKHEHGLVRFAPGNALELTFSAPFDGVLLGEVIEHVAHPDQFLASIARLVRPGGSIILSTPNGGYIRNRLPRFSDCPNPEQFEGMQFGPNADSHIFLLHDDELEHFSKAAGLRLCELQHFGNVLTNGHMKLNPLLRWVPQSAVHRIEQWTTSMPGPVSRKLHAGTVAALRKEATVAP